MKRIFSFIGSSRGEKSTTYRLAKMLSESLKERDKNITYDICTADKIKMNFCRGCWACSGSGICIQDATDDLKIMNEKLMNADLLIFGSPLYDMHISGQMKTFFDRHLSWFHRFPLVGKIGISVMTSGAHINDNPNIAGAIKYLTGMTLVMGVKMINPGLWAQTNGIGNHTDFMDKESVSSSVGKASEMIYEYLSGQKEIESDQYLEMVFKDIKNMVLEAECFANEKIYWEKEGILQINSFSELLKKVKAKSFHIFPDSLSR